MLIIKVSIEINDYKQEEWTGWNQFISKQERILSMTETPLTQLPSPQPQNFILIDDDFPHNQFEFQSLHLPKPLSTQQQQQAIILKDNNKPEIQAPLPFEGDNNKPHVLEESQLQKQFEEIRFGSAECNLMDLDMQNDSTKKSILQLTPYEYEQFVQNRVIEIQTPQLITEGYIMSYKLYQIKIRLKVSDIPQNNKHKEMKPSDKEVKVSKRVHEQDQNCKQSGNQQNSRGDRSKPGQGLEYDSCVSRRFSDFEYLNEQLVSKYGGFIIPLLPEKNFWAIVNLEGKEYAQTRTKSLTTYLNRIFMHKKLKHSEELKNFLFQDDSRFSTQKGEYLEKNKRLEDKIVSISSGAFEYGKALYSRFLGGGVDKNKNEEQIRLSKNKLSKHDLAFSEYEIIVSELMRIMTDTKCLVENVIQQIQTIDNISMLFSSGLTDPFNLITSKQTKPRDSHLMGTKQSFPTQQVSDEFEKISQFVSSCHAAIQRRKALRQEIEQLKMQQESLMQRYKNSPRSLELDIVRSKLDKLNKMNENYAQELIKQLEFHVDEGKGMLIVFVSKFENLRKNFFVSTYLHQ